MDGFCIAGQAPVLSPPAAGWQTHGDWLRRCAAGRAEFLAAEEQRRTDYLAQMGYGPGAMTVPTRAQLLKAIGTEMAVVRQSMAARDNAQRWGRLTSDEFSRRNGADSHRLAELAALRAQVEAA